MLFTTTTAALVASLSLILVASAQDSENASFRGLTPALGRTPASTGKLMSRSLDKRCTGSCDECFGAGYILCPDSSIFCYLPGDSSYGIDSCTGGSSGGSTATATAATPSSTGSAGTNDFCYQKGATCTSCFGPGYLQCSDGIHCYNPSDPNYDTCPDGSTGSGSGGSGTGGGSGSSSCADQYGAGSVPCGSDSCYNPGDGEVCCQDGYHCDAGHTCASITGKCCAAGSTSSYCSGSGSGSGSGGGGGGGLGGSSSYSGGLVTTDSSYSFPTSSSGLLFTSASARTTTSASAATGTGTSQLSAGGAGALELGKGLWVAAGVALIL